MRIVYLFTCFPVVSETFLQREIRAMREQGTNEIELWSLWRGKDEWEGVPVRRYPFLSIFRVIFFKIPLWAWRCPGALRRVWAAYMRESPPDLLNIGENLLGLAFALDKAEDFRANPPSLFHAVWGTMPAAAGWLLHEITGIPFSMGAHAYDVFRNGGDWTLREKLAAVHLVHTTTEAARRRLLELGAPEAKVRLIRRGLDLLPPMKPLRDMGGNAPLRCLSIGRIVPKKGLLAQLGILRALLDAGIPIEARIIGKGPLEQELRTRINTLGLASCVSLSGELPYGEIVAQYTWADVFLFTGIVAGDGDRDGLPNVIPEAMAHGVAVVTSPVSGTTEAIFHGLTGQVVPVSDHAGWVEAIRRLRGDPAFARRTRDAARQWVEQEFCAHKNAARLAAELASI